MLQGEDWGGGKGSKAVVVDMESYWGRRDGGGGGGGARLI